MSVTIRALHEDDYEQWLVLWNANNNGRIDHLITAATWQRLLEDEQVCGLVAALGDQLIGLTHYVIHPVTGHIKPVCYMQDVFVQPLFRRQGVGRKLITHLAEIGQRQDWARLYWLAETHNKEAQALYSKLGLKLDFHLYVLPL